MSDARGSSRPEWESGWNNAPPRASVQRVSWLSLFIFAVGAVTSVTLATVVYLLSSGKTSSSVLWISVSSAIAIASLLGVVGVFALNQRNSVSSLRIAVLGMPQVGKTTLITACFQEIFSRRISIRAVMSGTRSFEALNDNISRLAAGSPLKPTTDQDVAAYRFEIEPSHFLSPRYRVEFGDFPGEDTKRYAEEYGPWLHKTPFFEWALTCDGFAFCINVGPLSSFFRSEGDPAIQFEDDGVLMRKEAAAYVAESSAAIRAAWQHIVASFGPQRVADLRKDPLLLVFTKLDLLFRSSGVEKAPHTMELTELEADSARQWLTHQFDELASYLAGETRDFSVVVTSSFATTHAARLGISDFLHNILPSRAFTS